MVTNEKLISDEEIVAYLERMFYKSQEVSALIKDGKEVIAYEKIGGVIKNVATLRVELTKRIKAKQRENNSD